MGRVVLGVIVGYAVWTALWLGGNLGLQQAFAEAYEAFVAGEPITEIGYLGGALVLSVVCSFFAGLLTAKLAGDGASRAVWIMASLLLLTGIGVQVGAWDRMPVWYHLTFLILLIPVCLVGARGQTAN